MFSSSDQSSTRKKSLDRLLYKSVFQETQHNSSTPKIRLSLGSSIWILKSYGYENLLSTLHIHQKLSKIFFSVINSVRKLQFSLLSHNHKRDAMGEKLLSSAPRKLVKIRVPRYFRVNQYFSSMELQMQNHRLDLQTHYDREFFISVFSALSKVSAKKNE